MAVLPPVPLFLKMYRSDRERDLNPLRRVPDMQALDKIVLQQILVGKFPTTQNHREVITSPQCGDL